MYFCKEYEINEAYSEEKRKTLENIIHTAEIIKKIATTTLVHNVYTSNTRYYLSSLTSYLDQQFDRFDSFFKEKEDEQK